MNSITCLTSILPTLSALYDHRSKKSRFCGLHTVTYRVLNFVEGFILGKRIADAFNVNTFSGQSKGISSKSQYPKVSVRLSYGRGVVEVNGNRILFICENTRTIHHIDSNGVYHTCDYNQNYDVSDVIAQVTEVLETIEASYVPRPQRNTTPEHDWYLAQEFGDPKPTIKPLSRYTRVCSVKAITTSKKWTSWTGHYRDHNNRNYHKRESISFPNAYKVEVDGVVAWLPHSILGLEASPFDFSVGGRGFKPTVDLAVPTWWYRNNIKNGQKLSEK